MESAVGSGLVPEKAIITAGSEQGVKRCRGIIKKSFNTMDLGDFPEPNCTWHSNNWVQDAPEANTKSA